jgi:hypothetical protein
MYLYVVNIHSGDREKPVKTETHFKGQLVDRIENPYVQSRIRVDTFNAPTRRIDNLQLRSELPLGAPLLPCEPCDVIANELPEVASYEVISQEAFSAPKKHEPLAIRFLYLEEEITEGKFESILEDYYAFNFPSRCVWSVSQTGDHGDSSTSIGHFRVRRVEIPKGVTPEALQKEHYPFHDISNAAPFYAKTGSGVKVPIPFYTAPDELNTDESVGAFVEYLRNWVDTKKATLAWKKAQEAGNPLKKPNVPQADPFRDFGPFPMYASIGAPREVKEQKKPASTLGPANRFVTFFDSQGARLENILAPCDLTPYICEALFPELQFQSTEVLTLAGKTPYITRALIEKLTYVPPVQPSIAPPAENTDAKKEESAAVTSALWELYRVFDGEYIQKTKDAFYQEKGFTRNLLQAMWRIFVANPKRSSLTDFQSFAEGSSYIGEKALPKGLTSERAIEFFLENIINRHTSDPIHKKGYKMRIGIEIIRLVKIYHCEMPSYNYCSTYLDPHSPSLASLDFEPIVETLLNTTKMSEDTKKGWVKAFVNSTILKNGDKTAVLGSSDTHAEFVKWTKNMHWGMGYSAAANRSVREAFIAQFPIAEFTRLMKANGFEMTRRARGMVYLGASWKEGLGLGTSNSNAVVETVGTVEEPVGEVLPGAECVFAGTGEDMSSAGHASLHEEWNPALTLMGKGAKKREAAEGYKPTITVGGNVIAVVKCPEGIDISGMKSFNFANQEDFESYLLGRG